MAADAITFLIKPNSGTLVTMSGLQLTTLGPGPHSTKSLFRAPLGQVELGANTWGTMRALQLYVSLFLGWVA